MIICDSVAMQLTTTGILTFVFVGPYALFKQYSISMKMPLLRNIKIKLESNFCKKTWTNNYNKKHTINKQVLTRGHRLGSAPNKSVKRKDLNTLSIKFTDSTQRHIMINFF